jgi:hypothetical protein
MGANVGDQTNKEVRGNLVSNVEDVPVCTRYGSKFDPRL